MRACIAAIILVVCSPGGLVHAQSGTDVSPAIPVHPDVSTVLQLPDAVEGVWSIDGDEIMVQGAGSEIYVRPRPDTPAGVEAFVEVKTRTMHRLFLLRVVARAEDARRHVLVRPVAAQAPGESTPEAPPDEPTKPEAPPDEPAEPEAPALAVAPEIAESTASAPIGAASPEPITGPQPAERTTVTAGGRGFDLSAHLVMGLGVTALEFTGYVPRTGFQPHCALGIRVAGEPAGEWWALEVELSAETLAGPLAYSRDKRDRDPDMEVGGSWLRAMLGARAQLGTRWRPSVYAGIGAHAHLLETVDSSRLDGARSSMMKHGGVLALGVGLQYRTRHISLGFDAQVRLGELDEYRSITALLTVGRVLDEEKEP